jgi:hypothetical protein
MQDAPFPVPHLSVLGDPVIWMIGQRPSNPRISGHPIEE